VNFTLFDGFIYTVPGVIEEINVKKFRNKNRNILNKINAAIENKRLLIKIPSKEYIWRIEVKSTETGDINALSDTDRQVIALTLELMDTSSQDVILYTNDYTMENTCLELNITFSSLHKNGIKKKIHFEVYCPFCKTIQDARDLHKECERCGSKLKRRAKK